MTTENTNESETSAKTPEDVGEEKNPPKPPPEPWTPAKVLEWNAYYDIYVAVGVIILSLLVSTTRLNHSSIWTQLQSGKTISQTMSPGLTDTFSYTAEGKKWVHVTWLADLVHYQIFKLVSGFAPIDGDNPAAQTAKAEQWGIGALVVMVALLRGITAFILLQIRHKGPGLWWTSVCVLIGVCYTVIPQDSVANGGGLPFGVISGGISGRAVVNPEAWGGLFLAIELLLIYRSLFSAKKASLIPIIPLFAVWANMDESFFAGILILSGAVLGLAVKKKKEGGPCLRQGLIALGGSIGATLLNPSHVFVYPAVLSYLLPIGGWIPGPVTADQRSPFSPPVNAGNEDEIRQTQLILRYFMIVVGVGVMTFVLNRRRFNLSRFLMYAAAAFLWGVMFRWQMEFGLVFATVLSLNGQEWFQDLFGTDGKLSRGWTMWSIGGRAVTLTATALLFIRSFTGYGLIPGEGVFGVGFNAEDFPFEAAEYVAKAPIEGNILNTSLAQGDSLIWKSDGKKKTFIDSRRHVFSKEIITGFEDIQKAIRDDDDAKWKPLLDEHKVSVVMIDAARSPQTHRMLLTSKRWIPFRDDGTIVFFGRADASAVDTAYFKQNQLDADTLVYKSPQPVPSSDKLPRATTELDRIYQNKFNVRAQPHGIASLRWLNPVTQDPNLPILPDPARAIMAIREARRGLAINADDTTCYRRLIAGYSTLMQVESALLGGIELKPENTQMISGSPPALDLLATRRRQLITALSYAIQTTPPPQTTEERRELAQLNMELAQIYLRAGYADLARDRFNAVLSGTVPGDLPEDVFNSLTGQLASLNKAIGDIENQMSTMSLEQQANPLQLASYAQSRGLIAGAIQRLEEASQAGINPRLVKGTLLDLYCEAGMVDKALELWDQTTSDDDSLGDGPGTAALRQGRVFLLLGNYDNAIGTWRSKALPQLQGTRTLDIPGASRSLLRGDAQAMARAFIQQPDEIAKQAYWEFDTAMACLEAGLPVEVTAKHFTNVLTLTPDSVMRPVVAYYLGKLGKPIPPTRAEAAKTPTAAATPAAAPASTPAAAPAATTPTPAPAKP